MKTGSLLATLLGAFTTVGFGCAGLYYGTDFTSVAEFVEHDLNPEDQQLTLAFKNHGPHPAWDPTLRLRVLYDIDRRPCYIDMEGEVIGLLAVGDAAIFAGDTLEISPQSPNTYLIDFYYCFSSDGSLPLEKNVVAGYTAARMGEWNDRGHQRTWNPSYCDTEWLKIFLDQEAARAAARKRTLERERQTGRRESDPRALSQPTLETWPQQCPTSADFSSRIFGRTSH